ncbi:hypothetical protein GAPWKB11_0917 [Gilliamella apicola]|jgi:hypothetical protein|uniref:HEAT repeat domain-containing protein n=1 Tax=Gilliamella sp. Choc5-1 TaxID=3120238 RepID=UPI0004DCC1D7|nr:HEAT repeat domain-containing protein [Gilliamella apicola]KFA59028.1 hypothetical protein GAPWKB11_0917 [Gilliamella apicola]
MNINLLKEKYLELIKMEDTDDGIFDFNDLLLESDDEKVLEFHYEIIKSTKDKYLLTDLLTFFEKRKDKNKVGNFLVKKYDKEQDVSLKSEIIKILGEIKYSGTEELAVKEIKSPQYELRFACIIVLGWVGTAKDLGYLNERMLNDPEGTLRQCGAAAMRQIWFRHKSTKLKITQYINSAIRSETNPDALTGMIITIQDLYRKKLGIKESHYGDLSGDVTKAKEKCIKELDKILS